MRRVSKGRVQVVLATLLMAASGSGPGALAGPKGLGAQTAPTVTTDLLVNGAAAVCGDAVASGSAVGLLLSSSQNGTAVVTVQKGTGTATTLAQGSVTAGSTYRVSVTAGTADGLLRTLTVAVTNASGQSTARTCGYVVGSTAAQAAPVITTSLRVNGAAAECGATVASGSAVSLLLSSNQAGTAVVTAQKGTGTLTESATPLAQGSVAAGATYRVNVTAGAADGLIRTFTVTVTNAAGESTSHLCSFAVQ